MQHVFVTWLKVHTCFIVHDKYSREKPHIRDYMKIPLVLGYVFIIKTELFQAWFDDGHYWTQQIIANDIDLLWRLQLHEPILLWSVM